MTKKTAIKSKITYFVIVILALAWLIHFHPYKQEPKSFKVIEWDVTLYYTYLPATFIYNDIKFEKDWDYDLGKHQFGLNTHENGSRYIKMTSGMAIMYSPFFFIAHQYAKATNPEIANGYSRPYRVALSFGSFFYIMLGLWFLRKFLLRYFSDSAVAWTLVIVLLGTNLFHYTIWRGAMSHGYSFALSALLLLLSGKYIDKPMLKKAIGIGLVSGMIVLIRPVNALIPLTIVAFIFFKGIEKRNLKFAHWPIMLVFALLAISPQLIYWKYVTGDWIIYSYNEEGFFFNDPQFVNGLFSFRKGWLLYTPLMSLALIGIIPLWSKSKTWALLIGPFILVFMWVTFSWWCWWYGGSFSARPFIETYALLSIPLAASLSWILKRNKALKGGLLVVISMLVFFNLFQSYQYQKGVIHHDSMTKETYLLVFMKNHFPNGYWKSLETPDYDAAIKGDRD